MQMMSVSEINDKEELFVTVTDIANTGKVSSYWSVILWNIKGRVWLQ